METRGLIVEWSAGELTIWAGTQAPHEMRAYCSRLLGLAEHHIRVIMRDTGGGFGQKVVPFREDVCLMLAARKVPLAVKWIEDRRENLMSAGQARHEHSTNRLAFTEDGTLLAADIDHVQDVGAYPTPWPVGTGGGRHALPGSVPDPGDQLVLHVGLLQHTWTHGLPGTLGGETLAREVMMDIAARRMGLDPVDLRRRNMLAADELPYRNGNGMTYDSMSPREVFEQALEILDHGAFRKEQEAARADGRYIGVGTSSYVEPTTTGMVLRLRGRHHPHRAVRQGQRVRRRRIDRQQPRDHGRAARRRRAGRRHRGRQHDPGRHRPHPLRPRHRGSRSGSMLAGGG